MKRTKKRKPRAVSHEDQIWLAERLVHSAEIDDSDSVELPVGIARAMIELAKKAPKLTRGPKALPRDVVIQDALDVRRTRARKAELRQKAKNAGHRLSAGEAGERAAREISKRSRLSATALVDRAKRRKQRR